MVSPGIGMVKAKGSEQSSRECIILCMDGNPKSCHPIALGLHKESLGLSALRLIYAPITACRRCLNIHAMHFGVSLAFLPSGLSSLHLRISSNFGLVFFSWPSILRFPSLLLVVFVSPLLVLMTETLLFL